MTNDNDEPAGGSGGYLARAMRALGLVFGARKIQARMAGAIVCEIAEPKADTRRFRVFAGSCKEAFNAPGTPCIGDPYPGKGKCWEKSATPIGPADLFDVVCRYR